MDKTDVRSLTPLEGEDQQEQIIYKQLYAAIFNYK